MEFITQIVLNGSSSESGVLDIIYNSIFSQSHGQPPGRLEDKYN